MRCIAAILTLATASAADWTLFRSGPLEVWTNAGDKDARNTLATLDQIQWWTAKLLGRAEMRPLWPVRVVVFKNDRASAKYRTPNMALRGDLYMGGLAVGEPLPVEWRRDFVRILLNDDTAVMGRAVEEGLAEVLSTLEAKSSVLTVGTPPVPARRTRDWARMHLLTVEPENTGRVRVFFSNLQQASTMEAAYKNAFGKGEKEMEAMVDRYLEAGQFATQTVGGKPISLERDYRPRPQSTTPDAPPPEEGAHAWLAKAVEEKDAEKAKEHLRRAMEANLRWAEPHFRFSALMKTPAGIIPPLKKACELEPRNVDYWKALAQAQVDAKDFAGALVSWRAAERTGASPDERARIEAQRRAFEQQKLEIEAAQRKRAEDEKQRDLAKLKAEADARIREAEARANAKLGPLQSDQKPVEWWDGPKGQASVEGLLERVDCVKGPSRLHVRTGGKLIAFALGDPSRITIIGGEASFACGPQKPARKIRIEYNSKPTGNEVVGLEFVDVR